MITWALIIILGGMISSERKSGTAILVLTKPLSRTAFVLAKFVSQVTLLVVATVLGAVGTWAVTLAIFGEAPAGMLAKITGVWLVFAIFIIGVMTLASALVDSQMGSVFLGFGVLVFLSLASLWGPALEYTPAGLMGAPNSLLIGQEIATLWPLVSAAIITLLCVAAAVGAFGRKEL
ncbi:MAG: ABC transporter permease subunit, partial [Coriobacteriia bacterium]